MTDSDLWKALGNPRYFSAPMVEMSCLAWRRLVRKYGVDVCFTPMFHAAIFMADENYFKSCMITDEDDHPIIAQFCGNDPQTVLAAAKRIEHQVEAVDFNLGCPQGIARRGNYGAYLCDWELIEFIISTLSNGLSVPVTAKIRVFDDVHRTIEFAKMLERAGAQMITVHGRTREMKGIGIPYLSQIKAVKENVSVPVVLNGGIRCLEDADRFMAETGADGAMSGNGLLSNPALFKGEPYISALKLTNEYIQLALDPYTDTHYGTIKGHVFKMLGNLLTVHTDLREDLAERCGSVENIQQIVDTLAERVEGGVEGCPAQWPRPIRPWVSTAEISERVALKPMPIMENIDDACLGNMFD